MNLYFFVDVFTSNFIAVMDYTHQRILQIDLKTGAVVKLPLSISISTGLAFDKSTKTLFFSSINRSIMSTSLHGKNTMLFCTIGISFVKLYQYLTVEVHYSVKNNHSVDVQIIDFIAIFITLHPCLSM